MELYLIQHGLAKSVEEDPERGLNRQGEDETKKIAVQLKGQISAPLEIWHSGKRRAEQTAAILSDELGMREMIRNQDDLAPKDSVKPILDKLEGSSENRMIVGHLPYLSRLLAALLHLREDQDPVLFRNSGVICLKKDAGGWKIQWILHPDLVQDVEPFSQLPE